MFWYSILIDTVLIGIIFYGGILLMVKVNPRSQLHNYPPEIQKVVPKKNKYDKKIFNIIAIPTLILLFLYIVLSSKYWFSGTAITYKSFLIRWVIINTILAIFDLFVLDYFLFCTITPKFFIISGTEGNPGYKNKSYHTKTIPQMIPVVLISSMLFSLTFFII